MSCRDAMVYKLAAAAVFFKKLFQISLLRLYRTRNIGTSPLDSSSLRVFHLQTLKFYQIHALFQYSRKEFCRYRAAAAMDICAIQSIVHNLSHAMNMLFSITSIDQSFIYLMPSRQL